jgi:hypothetical protein
MDKTELENLINKPESPNLEFKSEFYKINHSEKAVKDYQRHELVKDILALANNNISTAGEKAYLIVGVSDELIDDKRMVLGVENNLPSSQTILDIVNNFCDPHLSEISLESFTIDRKIIYVVTIPPDPFVRETTKRLTVGKDHYYTEHSVFIRNNQSTSIASANERNEIEKKRRKRLSEKNIPIVLSNSILIGILGGAFFMRVFIASNPTIQNGRLIGSILGIIFFGFIGGLSGYIISSLVELRHGWNLLTTRVKILSSILGLVVVISMVYMFTY